MGRRLRWSTALLALLVPLVLLAAACGGDQSDAAEVDDPLGFSAPLLDGGEFTASSLEGTDTVLWFWAPWCTNCRAEAPNVVAVAEAFDGEVEVVGIAGRGEVPEMEDFVSDTGTGGLTHLVDGEGEIWSQYEVVSQPAFAFIDDDGSIVDVVVARLGEDGLTERFQGLVDA